MPSDLILKLKMLWLYKGSVREWYRDVWVWEADQRMCCDGYMCGCYGYDYGSMWEHMWENRRGK